MICRLVFCFIFNQNKVSHKKSISFLIEIKLLTIKLISSLFLIEINFFTIKSISFFYFLIEIDVESPRHLSNSMKTQKKNRLEINFSTIKSISFFF